MLIGTSSLHHSTFLTRKPISPSLLFLRRSYRTTRDSPTSAANGVLSVNCYMENNNSISGFANKVIGSLPVIGLVVRILSDEGGVGGDILDFAEFRRRVGKKSTVDDSRAFYEFQDRRGRVSELAGLSFESSRIS